MEGFSPLTPATSPVQTIHINIPSPENSSAVTRRSRQLFTAPSKEALLESTQEKVHDASLLCSGDWRGGTEALQMRSGKAEVAAQYQHGEGK